jgi:O-antigen/teichoic acid export membrane protein
MHSLKANFLWNASYQVLRIITPLITMPYLSRVLGATQLGVFSYTYSVATWFSLFCVLGLNQYGNREVARVRDDPDKLSRTFWSIYAMQIITSLIVSAIYLVYAFLSGDYFLYSLIWFFFVITEVFDINWFFFGLEEFRITVIRNFIVRLLTVVAIFVFVHQQSDLVVYCLIQSIGGGISYMVLIPFLRGRVRFYKPKPSEVALHFLPNLQLFAPIVAISFYTQLDKVLLGNLATDIAQVSFYDYSEKISQIPLAVVQALGTSMLPRMSSIISKGQREQAHHYLDMSIWFASILSFGFMFGIMAVAQEFIPLYLGEEYLPCVVLTMTITGMIPLIAWSNALGVQYLLPMGEDRKYTVSVIVGAVVNVVSNIILIPQIQAMGAVISTLISEAVVTVIQCLYTRKELPLGKYVRSAVPYVFIGLAMFLVVRAAATPLDALGILGFLLEIALGVVVYGGLCFVWMKATHDDRLNAVLKRRG